MQCQSKSDLAFTMHMLSWLSTEGTAAIIDNKIIAENGYNLSVSSYVEAEDTRPQTDIKEFNARIVEHENRLRAKIDAIIHELESESI